MRSKILFLRTLLRLLKSLYTLFQSLKTGFIIHQTSFSMVESATQILRTYRRTQTQRLSRSRLRLKIPMRSVLSLSLSTERFQLAPQTRLQSNQLGLSVSLATLQTTSTQLSHLKKLTMALWSSDPYSGLAHSPFTAVVALSVYMLATATSTKAQSAISLSSLPRSCKTQLSLSSNQSPPL